MILAQVVLEWSTIGIICGIVSTVVAAIVTLSTVYLKLFVQNFVQTALRHQNDHLNEQRDVMLKDLRHDFIQKEAMDFQMRSLEKRIDDLTRQLDAMRQ